MSNFTMLNHVLFTIWVHKSVCLVLIINMLLINVSITMRDQLHQMKDGISVSLYRLHLFQSVRLTNNCLSFSLKNSSATRQCDLWRYLQCVQTINIIMKTTSCLQVRNLTISVEEAFELKDASYMENK